MGHLDSLQEMQGEPDSATAYMLYAFAAVRLFYPRVRSASDGATAAIPSGTPRLGRTETIKRVSAPDFRIMCPQSIVSAPAEGLFVPICHNAGERVMWGTAPTYSVWLAGLLGGPRTPVNR